MPPGHGEQIPSLRGTSCHQQSLGRTEATESAVLHFVCYQAIKKEMFNHTIVKCQYMAYIHNLCTKWSLLCTVLVYVLSMVKVKSTVGHRVPGLPYIAVALKLILTLQ